LQLRRHANWEAFSTTLPEKAALYFFSKRATRPYWDARFGADDYLVFGCETSGLPAFLYDLYADRFLRIPMVDDSVRSLNLSTSVGLVLYEALRQNAWDPAAVRRSK
jgi:tRNA (cytidine/uridine-2'-O-)-methyltransferase